MAPNLLLKLGGKIQDGGTVESSRQARKIVTIEDVAERTNYTWIEREPRGDGVHKLKLLNLDTRTIEYKDNVTAERLKINPFEIGDTGFVNMRLLPLETVEVDGDISSDTIENQHTQYTKTELNEQSQSAYDKWKNAESKVTELEATMEQKVNDRVDQVAKLTSSAKERNIGKGR